MSVNDSLANGTRAAHDVGLAAWLGGAMFGKFAHNPSLVEISSRSERGSVRNAAWNGYNPVNAIGLGTAALGWIAARTTEANPDNLTGRERALSTANDGLMAAALVTSALSGVQGARLARQAPEGAVPMETGTKPATDTPPKAASIQRSLGLLGNLNIASGVTLVAVTRSSPRPTTAARPRAAHCAARPLPPAPARCGSAQASPPPQRSPTSCAAGSAKHPFDAGPAKAPGRRSRGD